jgi:hypothetical protein
VTVPDFESKDGASTGSPAGLPDVVREELLAALHLELSRAAEAAMERGVTAEAVTAYLDQRIDRLRSAITDPVDSGAEDAPDDPGDPRQLDRVSE